MAKYEFSKEGYIVYEDGGINPIAWGASEKWFATYDEAMEYAMEVVAKRIEELKHVLDCNEVMVYEGSKELKAKTHGTPGRKRVVFYWSNWRGPNS